MREVIVMILGILLILAMLAVVGGVIALMIILRVVVPTNMVHVVQSTKKTTSYGAKKEAGNTYYAFPSWVPKYGVTVTEFQESIFQVKLIDYEAYDSLRLPFMVDVTAFFRVDDSAMIAQRVANFDELVKQLESVLQGSVRRILATNSLEDVMRERSLLGQQFTDEVTEQIKEWGVSPVKTIEFLDLRDAKGSAVIANIMAKEKSRIEMESRIKVAENMQMAQTREIEAARSIEVQKQDAEQQIGIKTAEKEKTIGISKQVAQQDIKAQEKITTEREMEVQRVAEIKNAEIERDRAVIAAEQDKKVRTIDAEAEKQTTVLQATGNLEASKLDAEGKRIIGEAEGAAEKAKLMASVEPQITLAKEIGDNEGYQTYLITIEQVKVSEKVGIAMAEALRESDLKIIANSGDINGGIKTIGDVISSKGGVNFGAMLSGLVQTPEGQAIVNKLTGQTGQ